MGDEFGAKLSWIDCFVLVWIYFLQRTGKGNLGFSFYQYEIWGNYWEKIKVGKIKEEMMGGFKLLKILIIYLI